MSLQLFLTKIKTYIRKPWVIAALILVLVVAFFSFRGRSQTPQEELVIVKQGTVSEGVSVTGNVKPTQAVDLAFEKSGKVVKVAKDVGDHVSAGDTLIQMDNADLAASLSQAQAALRYQQSKLSELQAGTRPEQLDITKAKAAAAKADLDNARTALITALQSAYTSADDAVRNRVDEFFINPRSSTPQLAFSSTITSETSLESGRVEVEGRLRDMKNLLAVVTTTTDLDALLKSVKLDLGEIKLFMDNVSLALNALSPTFYLPQATLATWKADLALGRTNLNTAITSVLTSESNLEAAQSAYAVAKDQLALDTTGAITQEIEAAQAQVDQAKANVAAAYAQYTKTFLKSPIDGIVTKQDAKVGETAQANSVVISVMSDAAFEIEADVPEADIAKVKVGQEARITLDAYSSDVVFKAKVVAIDPAETIVDGVPTYRTTFQFENADDRIKSGMTANIDVQGETHSNVLSIPQRAIISHEGQKYVLLKTSRDTSREVLIKTGLRGSDGSVEILEGLSVGDTIVVSQK